jgi:deoxyribodipyrimidine photo-lyase
VKAAILWFRRDFRLTDNLALAAALQQVNRLIPVYIHAPDEALPWCPGAASNWWLHHSLIALDKALHQKGSRLIIARGKSHAILLQLALAHGCDELFFNRLPEPAATRRDEWVIEKLSSAGIRCFRFDSDRLLEGKPMMSLNGSPYRVFTPFWRAVLKRGLPERPPTSEPKQLPPLPKKIDSAALSSLELLPKTPWYSGFKAYWKPGEQGALDQLNQFLEHTIYDYSKGRDRPDLQDTSRLSPHLHFGEIGPLQILRGLETASGSHHASHFDVHSSEYIRQLGWREFAIYLLSQFPETEQKPFDQRFNNYPWRQGKRAEVYLKRWQQGKTGIPIVDAGMRELWQSGWMHNRVRMIVASMLTKNLGIHWLKGAAWFWDTLVDADCANNTLGWQWSAGCGADAAPYFRIFNPVRQANVYDPQGEYIRRWIPELAPLSNQHLFAPWKVPTPELRKAGITLGKNYPKPIVDLQNSRKQALQRWDRIKHLNIKGRTKA